MLDYYKDIHLDLGTELEFGKHQGRSIEEVVEEDPDYIKWLDSEGFSMSDDVYELIT